MKIPPAQSNWPQSWQHASGFDQLEWGGSPAQPGYTLAYQRRFAITLDLVKRAAPPPARVLDVAAGQGNFSLALAEAGYDVTWNDLRSDLAEYTQLKYEHGKITYRPGNAFELSFAEPFDVVLATEIIEHVAHPDQFLAKLLKLTKPGGSAIITTPNGGYFRNHLPKFSDCQNPEQFESRQFGPDGADHIFLLHEDELADLARRAGWLVRDIQLHTSFILNGHCRLGPVLRVLPAASVRWLDRQLQKLPRSLCRRFDVGLAAWLQRQ